MLTKHKLTEPFRKGTDSVNLRFYECGDYGNKPSVREVTFRLLRIHNPVSINSYRKSWLDGKTTDC